MVSSLVDQKVMGVRGFLSYVKKKIPLINPLEPGTEPLRIGVDVHGLLYMWQDDTVAIQHFLQAFRAAGHSLIFVFDGEAPAEKKELLQKRRQHREQSALQAYALEQFLSTEEGSQLDVPSRKHLERQIQLLRASTWSITRDYREKVIGLIQAAKCEILFAKGEADEDLVALEKARKIDVILSSDMDFIRFGVNRIWVPKFRHGHLECYDFDVLIFCDEEDINIENLQDIARLCGSEYEYSKITPAEAFGLIRYYGSLDNIKRVRPQLLGI